MKCPNCGSPMFHALTTITGLRIYGCDHIWTVGTKQRHSARPCNTYIRNDGHIVMPDEPYLYRTGTLNKAGEWTGKMETIVAKYKEARP